MSPPPLCPPSGPPDTHSMPDPPPRALKTQVPWCTVHRLHVHSVFPVSPASSQASSPSQAEPLQFTVPQSSGPGLRTRQPPPERPPSPVAGLMNSPVPGHAVLRKPLPLLGQVPPSCGPSVSRHVPGTVLMSLRICSPLDRGL